MVDYLRAQKDQAAKDKKPFDKSIEADAMKKITENQDDKVKVGRRDQRRHRRFQDEPPELGPGFSFAPANHVSSPP